MYYLIYPIFDRLMTTNLVIFAEHVLLGGSTIPSKICLVHQVEADFFEYDIQQGCE